jgi:hypothetical protein
VRVASSAQCRSSITSTTGPAAHSWSISPSSRSISAITGSPAAIRMLSADSFPEREFPRPAREPGAPDFSIASSIAESGSRLVSSSQ